MILFNSTAISRFWSKVDKNGPVPTHRPDLGPCWIWTAQLNNKGYGIFKPRSYHGTYAHRFSYELAYGPVFSHQCVLHKCDNPACICPDHLFTGSKTLNMQDCAAKLRVNTVKLTFEQIAYIRESVKGRLTLGMTNELAARFRVHRSTIRRAAKRIAFKLLD